MEPINISPYAHVVDDLMNLSLILTSIAFIAVVVIMIYFMIRYRQKPGHTAYYTQGNSKGALTLTLVLSAVVFIGIDVVLAYQDHHAFEKQFGTIPSGDDTVMAHVFAKQFEWNFRYPGPDLKFGTDDDFATIGELTIPVDKPILLKLRSKDVLHSFSIPSVRKKQDVLPGNTVAYWFETNRTTAAHRKASGNPKYVYEIACMELCGAGHSKMRGILTVLEQDEYDAWVVEQSEAGYETPEIWTLWPGGDPKHHFEQENEDDDEDDDDDE